MPGNTEKFRAEIELNSRQAQSELKKLEEQQKRMVEQQKALYTSSSAKNHQLAADMQKDIDALNTKIREQKKYINGLSTSVKDLSQASYKELAATVKALNKELRSGHVERNSKEYKALADRIKACRAEMQKMNDATKVQGGFFGNIADKLNRYQTAIAGAIASVTGLTMTIRKTVSDYAKMDDEMVDVQKYTGMAKEQVIALNEEFKKMDTRTPREQLNQLADAAGRLGISSQDAVKQFVDAADKINVALGDDLGDDAVAQIGKMAMAFGEDKEHGLNKAMLMTGSVVNELSQTSSASGGYLVQFAARMAGVGKQAGLTIPQIMSFGSVLDQNMQEVEVSATSLNQLITAMFKDPAKFAQLAGVEVEKFTKLLKTDANQALLQFLATMKNQGGFDKLAPMFDQMGLSGSRAVQVLSVLANKLSDVVTAENTANEAYRTGNSVMDEFNRANESAQAQLEKAQKHFKDLSIELGEQLMPVVRYTITGASALVRVLATIVPWLRNNISLIVKLAVVIGSYAAATKVAANWTKIMTVWQARKNILDKAEAVLTKAKTAALALYTLAVSVLRKDTVALTVAQSELNAVTRANPWGLLASVIATVIVGVVSLVSHFRKLSDEERKLKEASDANLQARKLVHVANKQANQQAAEEIVRLRSLEKTLNNTNAKYDLRKRALGEIKKIVPSYHATLTKEGKLINNNANVLADYCRNLVAAARAQAAFNKMVEVQGNMMNHQNLLQNRQNNQKWATGKLADMGIDAEATYALGWSGGKAYLTDTQTKNQVILSKEEYKQYTHLMGIVEYNKKRIAQESTIINNNKIISDQLERQVNSDAKKSGKDPRLQKDDGDQVTEPKGLTSTYVDPKETAKQQRAADKAAKDAEKKRKAELKKQLDAAKAEYSAETAEAITAYREGVTLYSDYIEERHDITVNYYDQLKRIYGEDSDEYKKLLDDRAKADQEYQEQLDELSREDMELEHLKMEAEYRKQYYDKNNKTAYQNEQLLDENIFQEKIRYIRAQQSLYDKTSKEWHNLEVQRTKEETSHQFELQDNYAKQLLQYRKEMGKQTLAEQEIMEKESVTYMFNTLKETGQMTKEEYDQIIEYIKNKYKNLRAEQNSPATLKSQGAEALQMAKIRAGIDDSNSGNGSDNAVIGIFSAFNAVKQQKEVNEQLAQLYQENAITFQQYEEAKRQQAQNTNDAILAGAQAALSGISNILSSASSYAQACSDLETARISANYQKQIDAAGNNSKKKERLEKKRDKELAKAKTKANKKAMKIEIAQALASTALAAINAYASGAKINVWLGPVAAALATAAGMIQVATIKKQHQAEEAGYYEGGYTTGTNYRRKAGVVHEGEFVANHQAVNNPQLAPTLKLIDWAQRNNRVSSLTAEDVSRANGGGAAVVAPTNVTVTTDNSDLRQTLDETKDTLDRLGDKIERMKVSLSVEEIKQKEKLWNVMQGNK